MAHMPILSRMQGGGVSAAQFRNCGKGDVDMKIQKTWFGWALLFLVVITLFGPSTVAYAGGTFTPLPLRDIIAGTLENCARLIGTPDN